MLLITVVLAWTIYTDDFLVQNSYFFNYRHFLLLASLPTALIWGIGSAWYLNYSDGLIKGFLIFAFGLVIIFATYNFLPWVRYESDQYSAAFGLMITGIFPATLSWISVTWFSGNLQSLRRTKKSRVGA